jgi:hypothetical protein
LEVLMMPRRAIQIHVVAFDSNVELYALSEDGSIWKYSQFKDLFYWDPIEPLPEGETRHERLRAALKKLDPGRFNVVEILAEAAPDATIAEVTRALNEMGLAKEMQP